MKVILLRDVAKLGKKNTVADVPDGYAQNKLIPSGMALPASPANLKRLERISAETAAQSEHDEAAFAAALTTLKTTPVAIKTGTNAQGGLFQAIKPADVAKALVQAGVHGVPLEAIMLEAPIKTSGEHEVTLSFGSQTGICTLVVTGE